MSGQVAPPAALVRLEQCLGCGGKELRPLALAYAWGGARFPLLECRACGLRFLGLRPAPEALADCYDADYFESDFRCGRSAASAFDHEAFRGESRALLDEFAALGPAGRLLEVGCATGWLLRHAAERGWQARGVEPSPAAVSYAREQGLEVFQGDLPSARLPERHFDLVYMGDVLEHVPDCRAVLAEAARVLKPGGWLYVRGPITTHSLARAWALALYRALGRTLVLEEPPYHLWEFTPRPLARLMRSVGLEVVRVRQSKIPPGRMHGRKSLPQRLGMALIDAVNLPLTRFFNMRGDRVVIVARRPGDPAPTAKGARPETR